MGCWNQTCGLTQLPIHAGDEVVLFILHKNEFNNDSNSFCYSTDLWKPLFYPVYGKYNDYGGIEDITNDDGVLTNFFKSMVEDGDITFKPHRMEKWETTDQYKVIPNDLETLINNLINEDDSIITNKAYNGNHVPFGIIMFHKHVYESVLDSLGCRIPYNKPYDYSDFLETKVNSLFCQQNEIDDVVEDEKLVIFKKMIKLHNIVNSFFEGSMESNLNRSLLKFYFEKLKVSSCHLHDDKIKNYLINYRLICSVMSLTRKLWTPQAGQGSQDSEYALHRVIWESSNAVIDNFKKQMYDDTEDDEYFGDDEEETIHVWE